MNEITPSELPAWAQIAIGIAFIGAIALRLLVPSPRVARPVPPATTPPEGDRP